MGVRRDPLGSTTCAHRAGSAIDSVTSRLPYAGICSEPQGRIEALRGRLVDAALRKGIQTMLGGTAGCAQLFDLTSDLLKLLTLPTTS